MPRKAAARIGQISQNTANALYTAEVPEFLRKYEEALASYEQALVHGVETPAERKLALYHGVWNGDIDPVFRQFAY